jgi:hypothetical protein
MALLTATFGDLCRLWELRRNFKSHEDIGRFAQGLASDAANTIKVTLGEGSVCAADITLTNSALYDTYSLMYSSCVWASA